MSYKIYKENIKSQTGIKAILEHSLQSYEKLPMLEVIFEKFVRQLAISLRNLTSEAINTHVVLFESLRFSDVLKSNNKDSIMALFYGLELENFGLLTLDNDLVVSILDILFGNKNSSYNNFSKKSSLTTIEQSIAKQLTVNILSDLEQAFEQVIPCNFNFEKLETNPNFVTISKPSDAVIYLKIAVEIFGVTHYVGLIVPYKTIEPIKEKLQHVFLADNNTQSESLYEDIYKNLEKAYVNLSAHFRNQKIPIDKLVNLKKGSTIILDHKKDEDLLINIGNKTMFLGKMGSVGKNVALHINQKLEIK